MKHQLAGLYYQKLYILELCTDLSTSYIFVKGKTNGLVFQESK